MFLKVPKVAYFYWGNTPMPFFNAATVFSFKKHHPDWELIMYRPVKQHVGGSPEVFGPVYNGKDYGDLVLTMMTDVRKWNCRDIGLSNEVNNVQKADLLRHYLMWKYGGLWVDMDVLFVKSIEKSDIPYDVDLALSYCGWFSSGVVLSSPDNPAYELIHKESLVRLNHNDYQSVGPSLLNNLFGSMDALQKKYPELKMYNMPMPMFYPYSWDNIEPFYTKGFNQITPDTVGIHWFGGNRKSKVMVRELIPSALQKFKGTVAGELLREFI